MKLIRKTGRCTHSCEEWRSEASAAFEQCSAYMDALNVDKSLYQVALDASRAPSLPHEAAALASAFKAEFEKDGAHLPVSVRSGLAAIRANIRELEVQMTAPSSEFSPVAIARGGEDIKRALCDLGPYGALCWQSPGALWATTEEAAAAVERRASAIEARREAKRALSLNSARRREIAEALASSRASLAEALGASSYAALTLGGPPVSLARDEATVATFIRKAATKLMPRAQSEATMLARAIGTDRLEPSDLDYARSRVLVEQDIPLFEMSGCVQLLIDVAAELGVEARLAVGLSPHETWHAAVSRLDLLDEQRQPIGFVYLDLHARPGKVTGAACFTVRGGCLVDKGDAHDVMATEFFVAEQPQTWGLEQALTRRQLAVVALVCSFVGDRLTYTDLETLLHEFGHALHSLLSNTSSQHLSGTRGATDVVELASTLLEQYAWHPLATGLVTQHYDADQLPRRAKTATAALDALHNLALAAFDQRLHGNREFVDGRDEGCFLEPALRLASSIFDAADHSDFLKLTHLATAPATYYVRALAPVDHAATDGKFVQAYPYDRALAHLVGNFDNDTTRLRLRYFFVLLVLPWDDEPCGVLAAAFSPPGL